MRGFYRLISPVWDLRVPDVEFKFLSPLRKFPYLWDPCRLGSSMPGMRFLLSRTVPLSLLPISMLSFAVDTLLIQFLDPLWRESLDMYLPILLFPWETVSSGTSSAAIFSPPHKVLFLLCYLVLWPLGRFLIIQAPPETPWAPFSCHFCPSKTGSSSVLLLTQAEGSVLGDL